MRSLLLINNTLFISIHALFKAKTEKSYICIKQYI